MMFECCEERLDAVTRGIHDNDFLDRHCSSRRDRAIEFNARCSGQGAIFLAETGGIDGETHRLDKLHS